MRAITYSVFARTGIYDTPELGIVKGSETRQ